MNQMDFDAFSSDLLKYAPRFYQAMGVKDQASLEFLPAVLDMTTRFLRLTANWEPPKVFVYGGPVYGLLCDILKKAGVITSEDETGGALIVYALVAKTLVDTMEREKTGVPIDVPKSLSEVKSIDFHQEDADAMAVLLRQA